MSETSKSGSAMTLIVNIILLIVGIALAANPVGGMEVIILILGIVMLVYAAVMIISNLARKGETPGSAYTLPVVVLVLGILLIIFRSQAAGVVLPLIVGIWAIVYGIMAFADSLRVKNAYGSWRAMMFMALAAIVLGIIILVGMAVGGNTLGTLLGVCIIIFSIVSIVQWFFALAARHNSHL